MLEGVAPGKRSGYEVEYTSSNARPPRCNPSCRLPRRVPVCPHHPVQGHHRAPSSGVHILVRALRWRRICIRANASLVWGDISIQSGILFLGIVTLVSATIAWFNIKKLQIDQHRKWMLRTWFYASSIITLRIVMIITARIISAIGQYYTVWSCAEVLYTIDNNSTMLEELYPTCLSGSLDAIHVAVPAVWTIGVNIGSTLRMSFGPALWIAMFLHAVGVEIYIHLTPGETARLRKVSYQKQLERGMKRPGSMGTVGDRLGDNFGVAYQPE
ncbi:hypothetical protein PM082_020496 [Marasmius tenuissimus]|nr:hypothetical protein PM082_020496 [Marasmius tenuissimus]